MTEWIVSTDWLARHLDAPDIVVIDASWHLPPTGRNGREEYLAARIPGALFFDIDAMSDTDSPLPHMLPKPEVFASRVRKLGIGDGKRVIAYDQLGLFSAARAWWMFRVMGHNDVAVLDGGLPKWRAEGRPVEDGEPRPVQERHFTARLDATMVRDMADVSRVRESGAAQIVDARPAGRFRGEEPEPRQGLRPGHVPGSRNVPFPTLLNSDGTLKSPDELKRAFEAAGVDLDRPVITMCGSGVTAAMLYLGLDLIGHRDHALYDGSWAEWGADPEAPIVTGDG